MSIPMLVNCIKKDVGSQGLYHLPYSIIVCFFLIDDYLRGRFFSFCEFIKLSHQQACRQPGKRQRFPLWIYRQECAEKSQLRTELFADPAFCNFKSNDGVCPMRDLTARG
jgi:hypothetical protein